MMIANDPLLQAALELYRPPFHYECGYIWDADNQLVADDDARDTMGRLRGWGRISFMTNAEALHDRVGELIAEALNEYWRKHSC